MFLKETPRQFFIPEPKLVLLIITVLGAAVTTGAVVAQQPLLAVGAMLTLLLMLVALAWPDAPTLMVIFVLYSNAAVVAVRFHDLPFIIGASLPILLVLPLANHLVVHRRAPILTPGLPLLLIFLGVQVFGTLFSEKGISLAMPTLTSYVIEGIGLYFLITNVVRTPAMIRRLIWILLIAGAFMGGLSLFQQVTGTFDNNYFGFAQVTGEGFGTGVESLHGEVEQPRLGGPVGEKNRYAQIMLMLIPLGLFRWWGEPSHRMRVLAAIFTGLILIGAALTFSRGAAVAFILMLVIMVSMRYIKVYQLVVIVLGLVLITLMFPQYATRLSSLQVLSDLASVEDESTLGQADGAIQGRATEMLAAALVFADHPLIGVGPGMFKYHFPDYVDLLGIKAIQGTREAHSLYLGIVADNGALGLICFLAIVYLTLRNLERTRKRWMHSRPAIANMATGFTLALVSYLTTGLFLHMSYMRYFWLMLALADATAYVASTDALARAGTTGESDPKEITPPGKSG